MPLKGHFYRIFNHMLQCIDGSLYKQRLNAFSFERIKVPTSFCLNGRASEAETAVETAKRHTMQYPYMSMEQRLGQN